MADALFFAEIGLFISFEGEGRVILLYCLVDEGGPLPEAILLDELSLSLPESSYEFSPGCL